MLIRIIVGICALCILAIFFFKDLINLKNRIGDRKGKFCLLCNLLLPQNRLLVTKFYVCGGRGEAQSFRSLAKLGKDRNP
jgi:hypothetical protein